MDYSRVSNKKGDSWNNHGFAKITEIEQVVKRFKIKGSADRLYTSKNRQLQNGQVLVLVSSF